MDNNMAKVKKSGKNKAVLKKRNVRWLLVFFDLIVFSICTAVLYLIGDKTEAFPVISALATLVSVYVFRFVFRIYNQIWRYGGVQVYCKMLISDALACITVLFITMFLPAPKYIPADVVSLFGLNLLFSLGSRIIYGFCYVYRQSSDAVGKTARVLLNMFGIREQYDKTEKKRVIKIAIVGAGQDGINLAESLAGDESAIYKPVFFIDIKKDKIGRQLHDIEVISDKEVTSEVLANNDIKEVVFAIPDMSLEDKKALYEQYKAYGCNVKIYEKSALMVSENPGAIKLREFEIEDLLFRNARHMIDDSVVSCYRGKTVLVTGGGGSIGSELCRQIAEMGPKMLVILDIYENSAYDLQQELLQKYKDAFEIRVEITSVCSKEAMEKVFRAYQPQIVLHAAAHKHVPLMEKNCVEAVLNNVFGTYNVVMMCEKYKAEHFIMISTDKAVNPTNVMGATKRVCEMITRCFANHNSGTIFSATRFGNVLGSAGSVIPLFKRQIASGGPVTITDKRINRFFMTIPEASQLVLTSGAMAKNGELFVLDMGQSVKIIDLAENMIRLSGYVPYKDIDIVETGLRPGEKLYEELLIKSETLSKTENDLIFIENDTPLTDSELEEKLRVLREAAESGSDEAARHALMSVVPTYHTPDEVNGEYIGKKETVKA